MARGKKAKVDDPVGDALREPAKKLEPENVTNIFKKREIPADRVFELRGKKGTVLHDGITTKCCKNLLEGTSVKYPDLLEVGESTETIIDGLRFNLVRTA